MLIAALLLYVGHRRCALDALELFTFRRTDNYDPDLGLEGSFSHYWNKRRSVPASSAAREPCPRLQESLVVGCTFDQHRTERAEGVAPLGAPPLQVFLRAVLPITL